MSETTSVCSRLKGGALSPDRCAAIRASETIKRYAAKAAPTLQRRGDRLFGQVNDLRQSAQALELTKEESAAPATTIQVGDTVRLFSGGNTGVVQEFRGNQAVVLIEGKVFHLSRKQLQRAESSSPRQGAARTTQSEQGCEPDHRDGRQRAHAGSTRPEALEAEARIDRFFATARRC